MPSPDTKASPSEKVFNPITGVFTLGFINFLKNNHLAADLIDKMNKTPLVEEYSECERFKIFWNKWRSNPDYELNRKIILFLAEVYLQTKIGKQALKEELKKYSLFELESLNLQIQNIETQASPDFEEDKKSVRLKFSDGKVEWLTASFINFDDVYNEIRTTFFDNHTSIVLISGSNR